MNILNRQVAIANYLYFDPIPTHDSTMSKMKHIIPALWTGFPVDAFEYLQDSLEIPLKKSERGTPVGVLAGNVHAIINGYAGLINQKDGLELGYSRLSPSWNELKFSIMYQVQHLQFCIAEDKLGVLNVTTQEPYPMKQKGSILKSV